MWRGSLRQTGCDDAHDGTGAAADKNLHAFVHLERRRVGSRIGMRRTRTREKGEGTVSSKVLIIRRKLEVGRVGSAVEPEDSDDPDAIKASIFRPFGSAKNINQGVLRWNEST